MFLVGYPRNLSRSSWFSDTFSFHSLLIKFKTNSHTVVITYKLITWLGELTHMPKRTNRNKRPVVICSGSTVCSGAAPLLNTTCCFTCTTNGAETAVQKKEIRQKENGGILPADSISETITEMLHPFPLSCFKKRRLPQNLL